jgi:hypothetical protein
MLECLWRNAGLDPHNTYSTTPYLEMAVLGFKLRKPCYTGALLIINLNYSTPLPKTILNYMWLKTNMGRKNC